MNGDCPYCGEDPDIDEWSENSEYQCRGCGKTITPIQVGDGSWDWEAVLDDEGPTLEETCAAPPAIREAALPCGKRTRGFVLAPDEDVGYLEWVGCKREQGHDGECGPAALPTKETTTK